ncbi:hypothetical protein [Paludisphaera mucosa]|uniref:Uncharacterized protein n=1 Tax=Paludisphaera mucosa TaxID=3030827 RepID=A0ABT6FG99_9BACT|nr:hypothetical protein [Paludisphaera mucosa]MDG3006544.1 hypothetical protein [Paludisphaera mucosa]
MTLRLVLVSLVAGLGLGLPAWPTIEGCVAGAQKWMNARLADMDVRRGDETQYVVIHDLLTAEMKRAHAARQARRAGSRPTIDAPAPARVATIALPHPTSARNRAEMLARRSADLAASTPPAIPFGLPKLDDFLIAAQDSNPAEASPAPAPAPMFSAVRPDELAKLAWSSFEPTGAKLAATFAEGLREAAERDRTAQAFAAMGTAADLYFDGGFALEAKVETPTLPEAVIAATPEPKAVAAPAPAEPAPLPGFEAMEQSASLYFAEPIQDDSAPAPEALAATTPEPVAASATAAIEAVGLAMLPEDVFAPLDEQPIVATHAVAEVRTVAPDVNKAVRLTREALSAWVNVLTSPALVTVSRTASVAR